MSLFQHVTQRLLEVNLTKSIQKGTLHVITPSERLLSFQGSEPGPEVTWSIHDWRVIEATIKRGDIGLGESYVKGYWDTPDLEGLFKLFIENLSALQGYTNGNFWNRFWFRIVNNLIRANGPRKSQDNIKKHYDVGNDFYALWLDKSMTYSSAIFQQEEMSLEEAQKIKYQRILDHIGASPKKILEIGCGWGGFAEQAIQAGHQVTGLTLSTQQYAFTKKRLPMKSADIRLQDYRQIKEKFDAIASIEMFEAVGKRYWPTYFSTLKSCLTKEGVAMVQTITIQEQAFKLYEKSSDYLRHYVFPGGFLPSQLAFKTSAENAGLICREFFQFGQHYAKTLKEWLQRFNAQETVMHAMGYSDAFIRSWRLYLSMCAASFSSGRTNVMQVELAHE